MLLRFKRGLSLNPVHALLGEGQHVLAVAD